MDILNKLCRACLTTKESFTYFLFENLSPETYWFCTSVKIDENDPLPKALCDQCYDLLTHFSKFKTECLKSQDILQLYKNGKTNVLQELETVLDKDTKPEIRIISVKTEQDLDISDYECDNEVPTPSANCCEEVKELFLELLPISPADCCDEEDKEVKVIKTKRKKAVILKSKTQHKKKVKTEKPNKKIYSCNYCPKKFANDLQYESHKQVVHEGKQLIFPCPLCGKNFLSVSGIRRHHVNVHNKVRLSGLSCSTCGLVCSSRDALREHEKGHMTASVDCMCHICGRTLCSKWVLKTHLETHKCDRERCYTCEHCGKKFYNNKSLQQHISRQHSNRRYICAYCDHPFTDKHNLIKHIGLHNGQKPYICDVCEKPFSVRTSLIEHKRIHSGERPFECVYCMKSFLSKRRLTDHHRIHTGEKPHKCEVCERRFTQRGSLLRHMKMHSKSAPVTKCVS